VTLDDLAAIGESVDAVRDEMLASLGLPAGSLTEAARGFDWSRIVKSPWTIPARWQTRG
jgi:glutamyl-tRNA synthetase